MDFIKKHFEWAPAILIAFILGGSLPFKFGGHEMPAHIFDIVGTFLGLDFFKTAGIYIIGVAELVASILVLVPGTRGFGGLLTMGILAGAIFFHLASPLGVTVTYIDAAGVSQSDGSLFYSAILAFLCGAYLAYRHKEKLPIIGNKDD